MKFACIWMFRNVNCMTWIQQYEVWNILILNLMKTQFESYLSWPPTNAWKTQEDEKGVSMVAKTAIPKVDRRKCQAWIYGCSFYKSSTEAPCMEDCWTWQSRGHTPFRVFLNGLYCHKTSRAVNSTQISHLQHSCCHGGEKNHDFFFFTFW